jgi:ribosomal protein L11 methyltransferase
LIRLAIRCAPESADRVLAELLDLVPDGVEEERGADHVEFAIYGAPGELPELPDLRAAAGPALVEIDTTEVPDDWADRWRDFHRPVLVGDRLLVRPSWARGPRPLAALEVVIDPGQAFGTGAHTTTRLCLELLLELVDAGRASGPLVDWGTGSGVLAIAAAKLGFRPVSGCDHAPAALEAAAANARANRVELELQRVNLREATPPVADTATANLTGPLLRQVAERMVDVPGWLVCSGLLASEEGPVTAAFEARGLRPRERRAERDWVALLLENSY